MVDVRCLWSPWFNTAYCGGTTFMAVLDGNCDRFYVASGKPLLTDRGRLNYRDLGGRVYRAGDLLLFFARDVLFEAETGIRHLVRTGFGNIAGG